MKSVLISIQSKWCELIANGKKTIEVRKSYPKLGTPFKCYIYCAKGKLLYEDFSNVKESREIKLANYRYNRQSHSLNCKVIGEFVCDEIQEITEDSQIPHYFDNWNDKTCLTDLEMREYANGKSLFLWHISSLKIYDQPKELSEFKQCHKCTYYTNCKEHDYSCDRTYNLSRPPQSWCYIEEI